MADTAITIGKTRTATVIFRNKAGQIIPPPKGATINGNRQYQDGGNINSSSNPTSITVKCVGTVVQADYEPPRGAIVEAFVSLGEGQQPIIVGATVGLLEENSSSGIDGVAVSAELIWGIES